MGNWTRHRPTDGRRWPGGRTGRLGRRRLGGTRCCQGWKNDECPRTFTSAILSTERLGGRLSGDLRCSTHRREVRAGAPGQKEYANLLKMLSEFVYSVVTTSKAGTRKVVSREFAWRKLSVPAHLYVVPTLHQDPRQAVGFQVLSLFHRSSVPVRQVREPVDADGPVVCKMT